MLPAKISWDDHIYRTSAAGVGGARAGSNVGRADEGLSLAEPGWIAGVIGEKLDPKRRAGSAVQRALNGGVAPVTTGGRQHRIVLQVIKPGIAIAMVIGCHAARVFGATNEIDADADVRENRVAENGVVDAGSDLYSAGESTITPSRTVEGDDVARASGRAAYGVVVAGVAAVINYINGEVVIAPS